MRIALGVIALAVSSVAMAAPALAQVNRDRVCTPEYRATLSLPEAIARWQRLCAGYQPAQPGAGRREPPGRGKDVMTVPAGPSGRIPSEYEKVRKLPVKRCFWRNATSGGPFGSSGTCPAPPRLAVGTVCSCSALPGDRVGRVVSTPGPGALPVLR